MSLNASHIDLNWTIGARLCASAYMERQMSEASQDQERPAESATTPSYVLDELIHQMTPETFPDDINPGPPVGREIW